MWVLPFPGPRGLRDGSVAGPNGAKGWVRARTQGGLGLGPFVFGSNGVWVRVLPCSDPRGLSLGSASRPKMGFGVGPSLFGPKKVGVWVLLWLNPRVFRLGLGYAFGPKTWGSGRLTQQKGVHVSRPAGLVGRVHGFGLTSGHDNPSARCLQLEAQPLPPSTLELLWLGMTALASGVCVWGYNTQCHHKMCNPRCNESW